MHVTATSTIYLIGPRRKFVSLSFLSIFFLLNESFAYSEKAEIKPKQTTINLNHAPSIHIDTEKLNNFIQKASSVLKQTPYPTPSNTTAPTTPSPNTTSPTPSPTSNTTAPTPAPNTTAPTPPPNTTVPTLAPTPQNTTAPTLAPTPQNTAAPTSSPNTTAPTPSPNTTAPTPSPNTSAPTLAPTSVPDGENNFTVGQVFGFMIISGLLILAFFLLVKFRLYVYFFLRETIFSLQSILQSSFNYRTRSRRNTESTAPLNEVIFDDPSNSLQQSLLPPSLAMGVQDTNESDSGTL